MRYVLLKEQWIKVIGVRLTWLDNMFPMSGDFDAYAYEGDGK